MAGFGAAVLFALPLTGCQRDEAGESDPLSRPASADAEDGVLWDEESAPAEGGTNVPSTASTTKALGESGGEKTEASAVTPRPSGVETPATKPAPSASTPRPDSGTTTAASPDEGTTTVSTARPGGVTTVPPIDDSGFGPIVKP